MPTYAARQTKHSQATNAELQHFSRQHGAYMHTSNLTLQNNKRAGTKKALTMYTDGTQEQAVMLSCFAANKAITSERLSGASKGGHAATAVQRGAKSASLKNNHRKKNQNHHTGELTSVTHTHMQYNTAEHNKNKQSQSTLITSQWLWLGRLRTHGLMQPCAGTHKHIETGTKGVGGDAALWNNQLRRHGMRYTTQKVGGCVRVRCIKPHTFMP